MKKITLSLFCFLMLVSCTKQDYNYTGNVIIDFQVVPRDVGIFDQSILWKESELDFSSKNAIEVRYNATEDVKIELNPGNYVCALLNETDLSHYYTFQIKVGQTTTVKFDYQDNKSYKYTGSDYLDGYILKLKKYLSSKSNYWILKKYN